MDMLYLIIGIVVGGILGYLYASRQVAVMKSNMELQVRHAEEMREQEQQSFEKRVSEIKMEQEKNRAEQQKQLTLQFENMATQILKTNSVEFKEMSTSSLKVLLDP